MDKKEIKSHPQQYNSLEQLIEDAYDLNPEKLEEELKWAERELNSSEPLCGKEISKPPEDGFQNMLAELKKRGVTPRVMADFDEESQEIFKSGDFRKIKKLLDQNTENIIEEQEKSEKDVLDEKGSKKYIFLQFGKVIAAMAACFIVAVVVTLLKPGIDVVGKKNYEYHSRIRNEKKGDIVWNNQEDYIVEQGKLEDAYKKIKEELGINVLKLNYLPKDVILSKLTIEERHAKLRFVNKDNFLYVLEVLYPIVNSANRFSDCSEYKIVYNEWIEKEIFIQKNKITNDSVEYSAYFEMGNSYYYLQAVMNEDEFIKIIEDLSLESE